MDLTAIANDAKTDKGTIKGLGHGYTLLYDLLFAHRRLEPLAICEIGLSIGGPELATGSADRTVADVPSIRTWHTYFPNAHLYGVDISDCSAFAADWFTFVQADCGSAEQLALVAELGKQFDVIIDDGSHAPYHQQQTLLSLFPLLKPGGIYIVEDMQWQPQTYAQNLPPVPRTDLLFGQFIDQGAFTDTGALPPAAWSAVADEIQFILQFDEDWLYRHRRQFNARAKLRPDYATYYEHRSLTGKLKRALGRMRSELQGVAAIDRRPRIKLAVIQKKGAA